MRRSLDDWPDWAKAVVIFAALLVVLAFGVWLDDRRADRWARAWRDAGNVGPVPAVPR